MNIHVGNRFVIVAGALVFKFPRVNISGLFRYYGYYLTGFLGKKRSLRQKCYSILWTTQDIVLGGWKENIREARILLKPRNPRFAHLYLPLLFVNIYKREEGVGKGSFNDFWGGDLIDGMVEIGGDEIYKALRKVADWHNFGINNFSFNGRNVVCLDYGGKGMLDFLTKYGEEFEKVMLTFLKKESQSKKEEG
ncbi:MAG: hypothetical protein WC027_00625 [Candidatus Paceibacterota bacterium]